MPKKRVVVTGMGVLAPNGNSIPAYWDALINGKSGIDLIKSFNTSDFAVKIAGELKNFKAEDYLEHREIRKLDPFSIFSLVTAQEAITSAGLNDPNLNYDRVGVILGTGVGGIQTLEQQHENLIGRGPRRVSPFFVPKMIANIAAGQISIKFGFKGPNHTIISACASGTDAIGSAFRMIQYGDADVMLAGGSEASVTGLTIAGFGNMKALSKRNENPQAASRPFDKDRDGFVLAEGSGILVLESEEHARLRGADILGEIGGYGATDDAYHVTQPSEGGKGAMEAMRLAVEDAGINLDEVDYINAHGTSTVFNDKTESAGISTLFGENARKMKISSTKSMTGHALGASGALEAIACVKAIQTGILPPTINYTTKDPECSLNYVPNAAQEQKINTALSNSFGFGGHNAVLVIKRWI
ncbi:MAG: beta-ketoacyl-ACP synthase II [Candidatus Neomarinimicrobiota bacterium]